MDLRMLAMEDEMTQAQSLSSLCEELAIEPALAYDMFRPQVRRGRGGGGSSIIHGTAPPGRPYEPPHNHYRPPTTAAHRI